MWQLWWFGSGLVLFAMVGLYAGRLRRRRAAIWPLLIAVCLLIGCASTPMNVIMTNPETGKSVYVSHSSWGWGMAGIAAAINAEQQQKKAIEAAKMMGYIEMKEVK